MRVSLFSLFAALTLLSACDGSSSSSSNSGGGGAGGDTSTTSEGGGGSASTSTDSTTSTDTDTTTTSTTDTTTTSTSMDPDPCDSAGSEPVLFAAVQTIFSAKCGTNCHLAASPSEGLSLKPGESHAQLVDIPAKQSCNGQLRVQAGSAAGSYLVNKITNSGVCPGKKKMPPGNSLSAAEQQTIIDWICQGALDN